MEYKVLKRVKEILMKLYDEYGFNGCEIDNIAVSDNYYIKFTVTHKTDNIIKQQTKIISFKDLFELSIIKKY